MEIIYKRFRGESMEFLQEKVRKFMGQNVEAGGAGIAGDNSVSFAEYVEGGVIVVLVVA